MTAFCRTPAPDTAAALGSVVDLGRNVNTGVASEELDFPLDDVIEGDATVVDVVVPACAAVTVMVRVMEDWVSNGVSAVW
jgi:hypothetical protein